MGNELYEKLEKLKEANKETGNLLERYLEVSKKQDSIKRIEGYLGLMCITNIGIYVQNEGIMKLLEKQKNISDKD